MPAALIGATQADSFSVFGRLAQAEDRTLRGRFDLWDPARYGMAGDDADALREYNRIFLVVMRELFRVVDEFISKHEVAYNKYKHGNSILIARGSMSTSAEGFTEPIGVLDDHMDLTKMKFILGGERVVSQFRTMQQMVVDMARALLERRLQLSEFGGVPLPILCEGSPQPPDQTKYTPLVFGTVPPELWARLEGIWARHMAKPDYVRVVLNLRTDVDRSKLQERIDYYNREWNPTKRK